MILDTIKNVHCYNFPKELDEVLDFLHTAHEKQVGRYDLSNGIYVLIQEYNTFKKEECDLENHQKYIDLQYVVEGFETIGIAYTGKTKVPYDAQNDIEFYDGDDFFVHTKKNDFVLLFPQDYHKPRLGDGSFVKKAVVKIPVGIFTTA